MSTKKKILIVDDSEMNRALLEDMLSGDYEIAEASNGMEACAYLRDHELEICLILLDIVMPVMDGFETLAMMNKNGWIKNIPVIMISAETAFTYIDRAYGLGAVDYISRPFDERTVRHRVDSNVILGEKQRDLSARLSDQIYEKEKDNRLMIEILSHIVEFRNGESGLHVLHVHAITELILKTLRKKTNQYEISPKDISLICNASALHDVGKITIPSEILNKPGKFTPDKNCLSDLPLAPRAVRRQGLSRRLEGRADPHRRAGGRACRRVRRAYQQARIQARVHARKGGGDDFKRRVRLL